MSDKNAWRHWWFQTDELRAMRDLSAALTALSALTAEWEPA